MIKSTSLLTMVLCSGTLLAEDSCLKEHISKKNVNTITGIGLTYEEAKLDLHKKLPQIGILQTTRLRSVKVSTLDTYKESNVLSQDIRATFDHYVTHNCKIDGKFAISIAFPKEGVSYLPKQHHKEIFEKDLFNPEYATYSYAKKICGDEMYTVIVSLNDGYAINNAIKVSEPVFQRGVHKIVVCGSFDLKTTWFAGRYIYDVRSIFGKPYNLIYLGSSRSNKDIRDYSEEMNLEMIKNALFE